MEKEQKGSMTVEASIVLMLFIITYLAILNVAKLTRVEIVMQHAINHTAMEISQYSYVLTKTGINDELLETAETAKEVKSDANEVISAVTELSNAIEGVSQGSVSQEEIDNLINAASNAQGAVGIAEEYFNNPKGLLTGILAIGQNEVETRVGTAILEHMAKSRVREYLANRVDDPDAYLESLGIVGGLDGLDFSESRYLADGTPDIHIRVRFRVRNKAFPGVDMGSFSMYLNASTRIW